jgi:D-alanine-D-alanine ligase
MARKINLMVLFGGRSGEHEVSLNSARSILAVIDPAKYTVVQVGITHAGVWLTGEDTLAAFFAGQTDGLSRVTLLPYPGSQALYALRGAALEPLVDIDVVFPVLHGTFGEDGTIQGLLELADLPYVGAGVLGSSLGMDKALFKDVMQKVGVPVLPWVVATRAELEQDLSAVIAQSEAAFPYPIFTKPANLGSSVGVTKCRTRSDLMEGLLEASRYDRRILIERGLEQPREIELGVLGNAHPIASVPGEIVPHDDFYTYHAKYQDDSSELIVPARLSADQAAQLQRIAIRAFQAIDAQGMARIDFLQDRATGEFFVSEINTIPGFTRISMYPKVMAASGVAYPELVDRLINLALESKADRDRTEHSYGRTS